MYKFTDKYICLVLTCNKSPYKEKLASNQHVYRQLKHAGFEVCFLYADPTLSESSIIVNEDDTYSLTVPTQEEYTNLAVKMHMAYCFFNSLPIKGILKIDDDVYYIDDVCLDLDYYRCDYLGICEIEFKFLNTDAHKKYRKDNFKHYTINYTDKDISMNTNFYPGYFYWISKKALDYVSKSTWNPQILGASEDAFVGLTLANKADIKYIVYRWRAMDNIKFLN